MLLVTLLVPQALCSATSCGCSRVHPSALWLCTLLEWACSLSLSFQALPAVASVAFPTDQAALTAVFCKRTQVAEVSSGAQALLQAMSVCFSSLSAAGGRALLQLLSLYLTAAAQVLLVVAALIAVPIMLLPKPLVLQKRFKARQAQLEEYGRVSPHDEDEEAGNGALRMAPPAHAHEEEFDFSEVIVHQVRNPRCPQRSSGVKESPLFAMSG